MEEARILSVEQKPKVIFDKSANFFNKVNVGDKGQCSCDLTVLKVFLKMDQDSNERKFFVLKISNANMLSKEGSRVD